MVANENDRDCRSCNKSEAFVQLVNRNIGFPVVVCVLMSILFLDVCYVSSVYY